MALEPTQDTGGRDVYAYLERAYIQEYLHDLGLTFEALHDLGEPRARDLQRAASLFASTKLSEVEARAHLIAELHGRHASI